MAMPTISFTSTNDTDSTRAVNLPRFIAATIALAAWTATLAACATSSVHTLTTTVLRDAKPADCPLQIFTDRSRIEDKHTDLAIITQRTGDGLFDDKTDGKILEGLRAEGCRMGADGLIVRSLAHGTWGDAGRGEAVAFVFDRQSTLPKRVQKNEKSESAPSSPGATAAPETKSDKPAPETPHAPEPSPEEPATR